MCKRRGIGQTLQEDAFSKDYFSRVKNLILALMTNNQKMWR